MKKKYLTTIILAIITHFVFSQGYEFGLVYNGNYNFSIIAIPDFTSAGNTDISDVGFTIMLPAGSNDAVNATPFNGREWSINSNPTYEALQTYGVDSGGRDLFVFNMPPGQTIMAHTQNVPFTLTSFDVTNMPTSGTMEFLLNTDPIAIALSGALDSFYNSDIDGPGTGTGTTDYFSGLKSGMESFQFNTLAVTNTALEPTQINIYPNPTSDFVKLQTNENVNEVKLYNLLGKLVYESATNFNGIIDMRNLPIGMYLAVITINNKKIEKRILKK